MTFIAIRPESRELRILSFVWSLRGLTLKGQVVMKLEAEGSEEILVDSICLVEDEYILCRLRL